ncbi:cation-transporting P-type ATPase [Porticoccus sp.]|mgnify:FL=1|uniref:cation-transporting P-type ATPase n=1 Tax=Porticoccus sp. TaxID=2024853 RepID=UPI000C529C20|nr:cation-transporting P-type ATPase [Porticoccus sp.]MAZ71049.1 carbonate dehydratase [Porticoccus sp.]|tara:strand:+ start:24181 stop:26877 length:2697 start_codon:yes stop_codon:yes gene_type:complete
METKTWYLRTYENTLSELDSAPQGLSTSEAEIRAARFGPNSLPKVERRGPIIRFLVHFHNVLIYVLLVSAVITLLLGHLIDTTVILAVVIVNALIGFIQEGKAEKAMDAINRMLSPNASVLRDGGRHTIPAEQLVPGDIVLLEPGDKVPADLRLIKAHGLHIQEAILTGESLPVEKQTAAIQQEVPLGDRSCMAFGGTLVTSGQGTGVVTAIAGATEIGLISGMLSTVETLTTPLVAQMATFSKWLTAMILTVASFILAFGVFIQDQAFDALFMAVVGLTVAAIPEGLPAVLTITLAIGVQTMARRNAIVRRLPAIETIGSVSVICTDKTGTLTRNEMNITTVVIQHRLLTVDGEGYAPSGTVHIDETAISQEDHPVLTSMGRTAALCNDSALHEKEKNWDIEGDPMEAALLAFSGRAGIDRHAEQGLWARTDTIPFDAKHRFMATLNHNHEGKAAIFVKGAPEQILVMCSHESTQSGDTVPLDQDRWHQRSSELAAMGLRVLALAVKEVKPQHLSLEMTDVTDGLTLLGLVGLMDPPRPGAITAVAACHQAGIQVKMITGDHAGTATAIARQIGLENPDKVLTGVELDRMTDSELASAVVNTDIFARTSPEHKLRLVMALQAQGKVVAMTGDGVNDAPALKRANVGIAMGQKGSEAAKEAAELVLADDNFATIVAAVREGRTVYDNIKKVISWTLPTNVGEAMPIVIALLLGMALPITAIQILWVNLITAVTLGIALAFEPTEENTMRRPPRPQGAPLLGGTWVWQILLLCSLFVCGVFGIYTYAIERGYNVAMAQTMAMNTLVVMEIFSLFFIRNIYGASLTWRAVRGTKVVWIAVILVTLAQFSITYVSALQLIFNTESVSVTDGLLIVAIGLVVFVILEIEKQLRLKLSKARFR